MQKKSNLPRCCRCSKIVVQNDDGTNLYAYYKLEKIPICKNCYPYSKPKFELGNIVKEGYRKSYWIIIDVFSGTKLLENIHFLIDAKDNSFLNSARRSREQVFYSVRELSSEVDGPSTVRYILKTESNFIPQYYLSKKIS
jgi:hypothetical protein